MKFILTIVFSIFLASCAHHHKNPEHHHHAYDKQCAYSVAHGDLATKGRPEYKIEHGGKTYYFSSTEKMNEFKRDIERNVKAADKTWASKIDK